MAEEKKGSEEAVVEPRSSGEPERVVERFKGVSVGDATVNLLEAAGVPITSQIREEMLEIKDDEAMRALMQANLGETINVKPLQAKMIFGTWAMQKLKITPIMYTWWLYNIGSAEAAIKYCRELLEDETLEEPTRVEIIRHWNDANKCMGVLLEKMQAMGREVGAFKEEKRVPKNKPPNVLMQTNVMVAQPKSEPKQEKTDL